MRGLKRVRNRRDDALAHTHWAHVETLLADYYRREGYAVDHCGTGATDSKFDGGIDLKLRRDDQYILVQCKHWNAMKVAHNDVHQLLGIMVNEGATGAILVTSGEFTKAAVEAATRQGHVLLVDGDELREMLGPLPEPEKPRESAARDYALSVGRYAGERLLSAAEDRIRGRASIRRSKQGAAKTLLSILLIKLGLMFASLIFGVLVVWMLLTYVMGVFQKLAHPVTASSPPSVSQPVDARVARPAPIEIAPPPAAIEAPPVHHEPTPEEIREQQRKAEEAMKIIEATTPEI